MTKLKSEFVTIAPGAQLNIITHTLEAKNKKIDLRKIEFRILYFLFINKGSFCSKEDIYIGAYDSKPALSNALEVHLSELRKKLNGVLKLETARGVGYRLKEELAHVEQTF